MKIAVTGANGHVGVNLCNVLKEKGHEVIALCHKNDFGLRHIEVECRKGDLLDKDSLRAFVAGAEAVVHLAARISIHGDEHGMVRRINFDGTRNLIETAKEAGIRRFIHFSSIHAFEQHPRDQLLDETRPVVTSGGFSYDLSKAAGEKVVLAASGNGLDVIVLSPTAIIGPADYEPSLTGKAMLQLYNRQIPALIEGGYNWVDVRDVVNGCVSALEQGKSGEKYLLPGEWIDLRGISGIIRRVTGVKTATVVVPFWMARAGLPFTTLYSRMSGNVPLYTDESLVILKSGNRMISGKKAEEQLGYKPRKIEETIRDLFIWFRNNGFIN